MRGPNKTLIKKVLLESAFDLKKDRRMAIIVEGKSSEYLVDRAIEFLHEARMLHADTLARGQKIRDAISILVAARLA